MKKNFYLIQSIFFLFSINSIIFSNPENQNQKDLYLKLIKRLIPKGISTDETYGYTKENPIKVGGQEYNAGPLSERVYLMILRGPNGENLQFKRLGSCCPFNTPKGFNNTGLLDIYEVTYKGLNTPKKLYLNMYDYEPTMSPVGFTYIKPKKSN